MYEWLIDSKDYALGMEFNPDDVVQVQSQQSTGLAFIYRNFKMVTYSKKAKLFTFLYFVIMPT